IASSDEIVIQKGKDGKQPEVTIEDIVGAMPPIPFYFNEKPVKLQPIYKVNGEVKTLDYLLEDKDDIFIEMPKTVDDYIKTINDVKLFETNSFIVIVNNRNIQVNQGNIQMLLNDEVVHPNTFIKENDRLSLRYPEKVTVKSILNQLDKEYWYQVEVTFNGEPVILK